jgi:hypothetical protein
MVRADAPKTAPEQGADMATAPILTTSAGNPVSDNQNPLTASRRGRFRLQD